MEFLSHFYPESKFGGFADIDVTMAFYLHVNSLIDSSSVVVDFGCGRGLCMEDPVPLRRQLRILKGKAAKVIGIDMDPGAGANPAVDEFRLLIPGTPWPLGEGSVDLIVCDCVMEHLPDPDAFFAQARRVLRPDGGVVCIRTPNTRSYIGVMSRLVPARHHASVLKKVQDYRKEEDVFPTLYRCNTLSQMRKRMAAHGFDHVVYGAESDPGYLDFSKFFYRLGVLHQKFSPRAWKPVIFAFGKRGVR